MVKNTYRVIRSILLSAIVFVAALYTLLFILLSVPAFQDKVRDIASSELSKFLKGDVRIGKVEISPFSEVVVRDLSVSPRDDKECLKVAVTGVGIDIWALLFERKIRFTYARLSGLEGSVVQKEKDGPLNIDFIIEAFKPKEKKTPPAKFDLDFRYVIIRDSRLSFSRDWKPRLETGRFDPNHMSVYGLNLDAEAPQISNDRYEVEVKRLSMNLDCGIAVKNLTLAGTVTPTTINLDRFSLEMPGTKLDINPISLEFDNFKSIRKALDEGERHIAINAERLSTRDFVPFLPVLAKIPFEGSLALEVTGNTGYMKVNKLELKSRGGSGPELNFTGVLNEPLDKDFMDATASEIRLFVPAGFTARLLDTFEKIPEAAKKTVMNLGDISIEGKGSFSAEKKMVKADLDMGFRPGKLKATGELDGFGTSSPDLKVALSSPGIDAGAIAGVPQIGKIVFNLEGDAVLAKGFPLVDLTLDIPSAEVYGNEIDDTSLEFTKEANHIRGFISCNNPETSLNGDISLLLAGQETELDGILDIRNLNVDKIPIFAKKGIGSVSGNISCETVGNNLDKVQGNVKLENVSLSANGTTIFGVNSLTATSTTGDIRKRELILRSDFLDAYVFGEFNMKDVVPCVMSMVRPSLPALFQTAPPEPSEDVNLSFNITVKPDENLYSFIKSPVSPLTQSVISGAVSSREGTAELNIDAPILLQGKNKLIRDSHISAMSDKNSGTVGINLQTIYPAKKGDLGIDANILGRLDNLFADIDFNRNLDSGFKGGIKLASAIRRNPISGLEATLDILPSEFLLNGSTWTIPQGKIEYGDKRVAITGLSVSHGQQAVDISGVASESPFDVVSVSLRDINLSYIFDTLNINYVTFGGQATGLVTGSSLFSKNPQATTRRLFVKDLSYNGAVLGDADLKSMFHNDSKMVSINADIREGTSRRALIDGGIWITRDSLSFDLDADKVNIKFLQPFMKAFSSDVQGRASGNAKLYGTFSDIDLTGKLKADTLRMKLDFTNVYYSGSDSVFLYPGHIVIPSFRIYDRQGHSGIFTGELKHRYFHEPTFNFRVVTARDLLVYNTDATINPDWYGTIYGSGSARILGKPGEIEINVDMTTSPGTKFTMALNDTQAASDFNFLTFSDRKREEREKEEAKYAYIDEEETIIEKFRKKMTQQEASSTNVILDLRGTVTPTAELTVIMDPDAGDKIVGHGNGSLQLSYDTATDEMKMYADYTLEEGTYNFSLQDIILKNFSIRNGSNIKISGDPLDATLDITASYRVNTNLSDLDKSFSTDRDLNRTNVPVDALLKVHGQMTRPEIDYDIELPTLTSDVTRKVKSIISTDDQMSRQILYLLALNRFYTPEYTGSSSERGSELTSVASSTLSSQLSNILSGMTDYLSVAPSFRSDKGDFSDMEVDVALSSRLLDNRLLLNGNFGYRDRSTSTNSSQFIGDFDIEYILTKNGNLRLKAYNHFNDRSFYFKQALTTQGIGVILRKDFDNLKTLFRGSRRKKKEEPADPEAVKNSNGTVEETKQEPKDDGEKK